MQWVLWYESLTIRIGARIFKITPILASARLSTNTAQRLSVYAIFRLLDYCNFILEYK